MGKGFWDNIVTTLDDPSLTFASDKASSAEFTGWLDTGAYILNALFSGSLYGGIPNNKVTMFAGEESVGKTFFVLAVLKTFLDENPEGAVFFYDTENAVTDDMLTTRGIDSARVIKGEPVTIQEFTTKMLKAIDAYTAIEESARPPIMFILDSLGNLSTTKELADKTEGNDTRDMTRAQVNRAAFRTVTLKLGKAKAPLLITNHVYEVVGSYVPTKAVSGGGGSKYAASTIAMLSKKKDKNGEDAKEVTGNIIKIKLNKSRFTKENKEVEVRLSYASGLDRYYGLVPLGEKYGIIKRIGNKYEFPNGIKAFEKAINRNPQEYFNEGVMAALEQAAAQEYKYGNEDSLSDVDEQNETNE